MKICKNCGNENNDMSVYCSACGSLLDGNRAYTENGNTQNEAFSGQNSYSNQRYEPYGQNSQQYGSGGYGQQQNGYYAPMPTPNVTKNKVIAALVIGILFGGIIGIIFAVLALVAYGDYESAVARGDFSTATLKCEKIKTYNKIAWIFDIIGIAAVILGIIAFICVTVFAVSFGGTDIPTDFFEFGFNEVPFGEAISFTVNKLSLF